MPRLNKGHRDPTFDNATGHVDKEWKQIAKLAVKVRELQCDPEEVEQQEKLFTGIFKRLLEDPIEEVKREAGR